MGLSDKIDRRIVTFLDPEDNEKICKDLKEKVMKQLTPQIISRVNKNMILGIDKWKEDYVRPAIVEEVNKAIEKRLPK